MATANQTRQEGSAKVNVHGHLEGHRNPCPITAMSSVHAEVRGLRLKVRGWSKRFPARGYS